MAIKRHNPPENEGSGAQPSLPFLPSDLWQYVFREFTTKEIVKTASVSHEWRGFAHQATADVFIFKPHLQRGMSVFNADYDENWNKACLASMEASVASRLLSLKVLVVHSPEGFWPPFADRLFKLIHASTLLEVLDVRYNCEWEEVQRDLDGKIQRGPDGKCLSWERPEMPPSLRVFRTDITLENGIPEAASLPNLKFLEFHLPEQTGLMQAPSLCSPLPELRVLKLKGLYRYGTENALSSRAWENLRALELLDLCYTSDSSCIALSLSHCKEARRALTQLPIFKSLKVWRLTNISFLHADVALIFGKQSALQKLDIQSPNLTSEAMQNFLGLPQIKELTLNMSVFYEWSYSPESRNFERSNLERITLIGNHFRVENFIDILHMPNLRFLGIEAKIFFPDLTESQAGRFQPCQEDLKVKLATREGLQGWQYLEKMGFERHKSDRMCVRYRPYDKHYRDHYFSVYEFPPEGDQHASLEQSHSLVAQDLESALGPNFSRQSDTFKYLNYLQELEDNSDKKK